MIEELLKHGIGIGPAVGRDINICLPGRLERVFKEVFDGATFFNGALILRPLRTVGDILGISEWNSPDLWRSLYGEALDEKDLLFSEDAFGYQFLLSGEQVIQFDPETGERKLVAQNIDEWADLVLSDISYWTGEPVVKAWEQKNGKLAHGCRLIPRIPFVCGGEFHSSNLVKKTDVEGMKIRSSLAAEVREMPDGSKIKFEVID